MYAITTRGAAHLILYDIVDGIGRTVEGATQSVTGVFEPTIRLGVTGLSRAGKTVFITSLIANLMDRARMGAFRPPICTRSPTTRSRASTSRPIWPR